MGNIGPYLAVSRTSSETAVGGGICAMLRAVRHLSRTAISTVRRCQADFAPAMAFPPDLWPLILPWLNLRGANPPPSADSAQRQATSGADRTEPNRAAENASAVCFDTTYEQVNSLRIRAKTL